MQVNMHEAKTQLSRLAERAWEGEEVIIAKAGKPYLRLAPLTFVHAQQAGSLPEHHIDPCDCMLVAQAQIEGLTLVTANANIPRYAVRTMPAQVAPSVNSQSPDASSVVGGEPTSILFDWAMQFDCESTSITIWHYL